MTHRDFVLICTLETHLLTYLLTQMQISERNEIHRDVSPYCLYHRLTHIYLDTVPPTDVV